MNQSITTINTRLLDSLTQIILALSQEEYQILVEKIQHSRLTETQNIESLKQDIAAGIQQLENGEYTEYDENNLSTLITSIKSVSLSSSKFC